MGYLIFNTHLLKGGWVVDTLLGHHHSHRHPIVLAILVISIQMNAKLRSDWNIVVNF
jgi:hypothetical protein